MKKILLTVMTAILVITGTFALNTEKASATSTVNEFYIYHPAWSNAIQHSISTADSGADVKVSFVQGLMTNGYPANGAYFDWKMELQRKGTDGIYDVIATKTGWVTYDSPSHRTFYGIAITGRTMRVKMTIYGTSSGTVYKYSDLWVR